MKIPLQSVTQEAFAPFGRVLEFPTDVKEPFHIVITEEKEPWRLAVFRYQNKKIETLERHPTSLESFEPLSGATVLLVAEYKTPETPSAFFLDKPICLYRGIWHQVLSLTSESQVKIAENLEVPGTEFFKLRHPVGIHLADIQE